MFTPLSQTFLLIVESVGNRFESFLRILHTFHENTKVCFTCCYTHIVAVRLKLLCNTRRMHFIGTPSAAACSFESNMLEESPDTIESTSETSSALFEESSNAVEAEDTPMQFEEPSVQPLQLQMAAATFLVTLKEKYKV